MTDAGSRTPGALIESLTYLTEPEKEQLDRLLTVGTPIWVPLNGPQRAAFTSEADFLFYGGAAGGGKTDLGIGLALLEHQRSIIFRREYTQLQAIEDRVIEILGTRHGYNSHANVWDMPDGR